MRFVGQHFSRSGCERVRIYATMHGAHCCPDSWSLPDVRRVVIAMPGVPGVEFPAVSWRIRAADCPTDFTADLGGGIRGGFRREFFLVPLLARNARKKSTAKSTADSIHDSTAEIHRGRPPRIHCRWRRGGNCAASVGCAGTVRRWGKAPP